MMEKDKRRAYTVSDSDGKHLDYAIFCPACKCAHVFDDRWTFNGDHEKPTFSPSMLSHENPEVRKTSNGRYGHRCHSFVRNGQIQFLGDCTHDMKNKTVDLEPF